MDPTLPSPGAGQGGLPNSQMQFLQWLQQSNPRFNPNQFQSGPAFQQLQGLVNAPTNAQNVASKMMIGLMHPPPGKL